MPICILYDKTRLTYTTVNRQETVWTYKRMPYA